MKNIFRFLLVSFCFAEEPSHGKSIETQIGQNFTITLESNATTGSVGTLVPNNGTWFLPKITN